MNTYEVKLEIPGPTAMWTRPDTGSSPVHAQAEFAGHHDSTTRPPHAYFAAFNRALERGQWFYTPCLGWKEFVPDYVGPFRPVTRVCATENHEMATMLQIVFDTIAGGLNWN